jgi:hypothetical protein
MGHVSFVGEMRNAFKLYSGSLKAIDRFVYQGVFGRVTYKLILKKFDVKVWIGFIWLNIQLLRIWSSRRLCELFGFSEWWKIPLLDERLLVSQELHCMEIESSLNIT